MEVANKTYLDKAGQIKVEIDLDKCIACGRCVTACKHDARYYSDDTKRFFDDLLKGIPISVMAAPAIKTNIPKYKQLFTYLKQLGVKKIYDVSLGADICIWAHIRYMEQNESKSMITQPCPAIVTYCEMYQHDLLDKLSPVHSPMACTSIYMKEYQGIKDRLAALSPCMAKSNEFECTKLAEYNITFELLLEYLDKNNIKMPDEETEFDHDESGLGSLFPMPGGLKENIEFFTGRKLHISKSEGFDIYENLDLYAKTPEIFRPDIFDVLNCSDGCNIGTANSHKSNMFEIDKAMNDTRKKATEERKREYYRSMYERYDKTFELSAFIREYKPIHLEVPKITTNDIDTALDLLGKTEFEQQHIDCFACGSDTCYAMARKIALGVNIPSNCIFKSKEDARMEHEENLLVHAQLVDMEKTRDADERMRIMMDATPISAHFWDENYQLVDCNLAAVKMFDLSSKQEYIEKYFDLTPKYQPDGQHSIDRIKEIIKEVFETGYKRVELMRKSLKGEPIPVEGTFVLVDHKGDKMVAGYCRDLREHKRMTQVLETTIEKAQAASRAKGDFLANMSHEIRTPMNTIIGMTNIAKSAESIEKKDYALEKIGDASNHLLGIINDILDMSKIEADKLELHPEPFIFEEMLKKVTGIINFRVLEKRQSFSVYIDKKIPPILVCDNQRLAQVITNLLANAVKFTPEFGSISLKADFIRERNGFLDIRFELTDTGVGIGEEHQARLFNPFEQAESSTTRKYGGTGLGLAITKRIVELMEGAISVSSVIGEGSTFSFTIRAEKPDKTVEEGFKPVKLVSSDNLRVLIVDDDDDLREYLADLATRFSILCDTVASGEEAIKLFENGKTYDICFIDCIMPGIDGIELASRLKESHAKDMSMVMVSSTEWQEIAEDARAAGIKKFLPKPIFPTDFVNCINSLLGADLFTEKKAVKSDFLDRFIGYRILLAEDVEINREIVKALLEPMKIEVDSAENGIEAVNLFKKMPDKYDLIFMDLQMPEMDGYDATRTIRALNTEKAQTIPIIAMTANVFREDIDNCFEAGMNGHIGKPLDFDEVMSIIDDYLSYDRHLLSTSAKFENEEDSLDDIAKDKK